MRIYTDTNGLHVNAISTLSDGTDVNGHAYQVQAGLTSSAIVFQTGTIPEVGINGITNEALLTVMLHRMGVINGKFPCSENELAIYHLQAALSAFELRTTNRKARGVEGKHLV